MGKYETGIENEPKTDVTESEIPTEVPVIKQNAYPYNNITWIKHRYLQIKWSQENIQAAYYLEYNGI